MDQIVSWIATATTIIAACMTASNLGSRITGYGFVVFTVGSIAWFTLGMLTDQPALIYTNLVMTVLNLFGVWRWLGRQAKVEEGAKAAAQVSRDTPGEALFPVSLLTRGALKSGGTALGTSVDAMAGCRTGRIAYVVVSEGGVAGVGETLRRIPWDRVRTEDDALLTEMGSSEFGRLEQVQRDQWPER
jgi:hypothetical protein